MRARVRAIAMVAGLLLCAGCATPRVIEPPTAAALDARRVERTGGGVQCSAMVLDDAQSKELLRVAAADRGVIAVMFGLANLGTEAMALDQNAFRLRVNGSRRIAPALPGRAASLLRDESGSQQAIWAGYLVFGALAAPSIEASQKREDYAARTSRELIFSTASVAGGDRVVGYLIFESPFDLDEVAQLALEMATPSHDVLELPLTLPARDDPAARIAEMPHATYGPRVVESDLPATGLRHGER